eukprot:Rhum_TRINITY_DN6874_c0_g2::Rhum_TRINITY_DN6874_c0_g2_i1::g.21123::m.21123
MSTEEEWKAMWDLFDRPPRTGKLAKETVKHCVRALGRVYRDSELDDLLSMGQEGNHPVTYSTYVEALKKPHAEPEPGSLKAAVMAFDGKETGLMPEQLLLKILSDGDEPMPAALCEEGMHGITFKKGAVDNDELIAVLEQEEADMHPTLDEMLKLAR